MMTALPPWAWMAVAGLILVLGVLPSVLIRVQFDQRLRSSFRHLRKFRYQKSPYSASGCAGMGEGFIYVPHPYTNWSLNPSYRNAAGDRVHTDEGFRKTVESDSIYEMLRQAPPGTKKIVCLGGSTTYCTDIERYQDTWPALLPRYMEGSKSLTFNFGVGGWGTLQSLIRCASWFPIVKPDLVILYQLKNDLTPLYNGDRQQATISPDTQNVLNQLSNLLNLKYPRMLSYLPLVQWLELKSLARERGLVGLYYNKYKNIKGLDRLTDEFVDNAKFRVEAILHLAQAIGAKVLYVPEIVRSGDFHETVQRLQQRINPLFQSYPQVTYFDATPLVPSNDSYFNDTLHFNEKGCDWFARIIGKKASSVLTDAVPSSL